MVAVKRSVPTFFKRSSFPAKVMPAQSGKLAHLSLACSRVIVAFATSAPCGM